MYKVFVEYQIKEDSCEAYRSFMKQQLDLHPSLELYEGTDQPGLYVEIWSNIDPEAYGSMKRQRKEASAQEGWEKLEQWVKGGLDKVHIWHFTAVQ